jgi:glycosyltransferase involved in cell wall biosynthesis
MRSRPRIVGICLVRNEENFVAWSLTNVARFCDFIIVLDNKSSDATPQILRRLSQQIDNIEVTTVDDAYDTHRYIEWLAGKQAWVFGVDGDEIYDASGLARLRRRILSGEFRDRWRLIGHSLHVKHIDWNAKTALGYAQPAARSITKLYNFEAITSWHQGKHERLHGKSMQFRPGYSKEKVHNDWEIASWGESDFRCLHTCFMRRSPLDSTETRHNPSEIMKSNWLRNRLLKGLGLDTLLESHKPSYKERFYAQGDLTSVDISPFGHPPAVIEPVAVRSSENLVETALIGVR